MIPSRGLTPWCAPVASRKGLAIGIFVSACSNRPITTADAQLSPGSAHVTIVHDQTQQDFDWAAATGATIVCRDEAPFYFIRMGRSSENEGEDDVHIDLAICNFEGMGAYPTADPSQGCEAGQRFFHVYWHTASGDLFADNAASTPCTLDIAGDVAQLGITVRCDNLVRPITSPDRVAVRAVALCTPR
jgi:hypothetical protein